MLMLFLDDWFLDGRTDVTHHFPIARPGREIIPPKDPAQAPRVTWNPARQCYETTVGYYSGRPVAKESADGRRWTNGPTRSLELLGPPPTGCVFNPKVVLAPHGGFDCCSNILADEWDPDPERRYKRLFFPFSNAKSGVGGIEGGPGLVGCSADGLRWTTNARHAWYTVPNGSDTLNNLVYNPFRGVWQAVCRRCNCDRRIAIAESPDLEHWTQPRVVLHPDAMDPPLLQFYGMPVMLYDRYFIGAVQRYFVPNEDAVEPRWAKMSGRVDGQLVYSYDGENWLRPTRTAFMLRTEPGEGSAGGSIYPIQFRTEPGRIVIAGLGFRRHHSAGETLSPLVEYELRQDGFSYLEPTSGCGTVITRGVCPTDRGGVTLNTFSDAGGSIVARVLDWETHSTYAPIAGYDFQDCIPVSGDRIDAPLRWKQHADLRELAGRRVRLELRLCDARLYAIRLDGKPWYTNTKTPVAWV